MSDSPSFTLDGASEKVQEDSFWKALLGVEPLAKGAFVEDFNEPIRYGKRMTGTCYFPIVLAFRMRVLS